MMDDFDRPKNKNKKIANFAGQPWEKHFVRMTLNLADIFVSSRIMTTHDDLEFSSEPPLLEYFCHLF